MVGKGALTVAAVVGAGVAIAYTGGLAAGYFAPEAAAAFFGGATADAAALSSGGALETTKDVAGMAGRKMIFW